ncbi:MAG: alpha/beta hydrolase, partial [archaeon]|nr:alpha/beta hydrolase [archaeon]
MAEKNSITYEFIQTNGIKLHVAFAGKKEGEPVILLHGFPDASFGWEFQMEALANKGFYVIAPDQRGYNLSDKPKGKKRYMMNLLVTDIIGLADSLNIDKFNLAGHDFGAIVSWNLMQHHSERIKHLVIFNVPHPKVMARYQKKNKDQRKRSWYAYFFIMPLVPELYLKITNRKRLILSM